MALRDAQTRSVVERRLRLRAQVRLGSLRSTFGEGGRIGYTQSWQGERAAGVSDVA